MYFPRPHPLFPGPLKSGLLPLLLAALCLALASPAQAKLKQAPPTIQASAPTLDQTTPRYVDNGDGTVTDTESGLIWLKDATCLDVMTWNQALEAVETIGNGLRCDNVTLSDGSAPGDWRLPTIRELLSLPDPRYYKPALSNGNGTDKWSEGDAFNAVSPFYYWSSTAIDDKTAWYLYLYDGTPGGADTNLQYVVWPVRGTLKLRWRVNPAK